ncbi:HlyD family efflux transporter periplasmic adaptor subunit [Sphingomonas sp.]|jgi:membrane fusion protein (multidrug efflux system)|uniref:HlyD family secretion protein n=1 Tax=Sphingomonas sp. TaxID=28214 RepID=UPI002E11EF64|nr:HlyD family efflux transporter periplasmic adaptor subunit [Sphingomonas sp.]
MTTLEPLTEAQEAVTHQSNSERRKKLFIGLGAAILVIGGGAYAYQEFVASNYVETDNAYVGANIAQITPLVGAPVAKVLVDEAQRVKAGDILVQLDDTDAKLAVAQAEAQLALTERKVRGLMATDSGLTAQIASRRADQARADAQLASAQANLEKARVDLRRREALVQSGSVSAEEVTSARNAFAAANADVRAAQAARAQALANRESAIGDRDANKVLISNAGIDNNPEVLAARAELDQARVNLARTVLRAPVDGVVSQRKVQVGQLVQPGQALMSVVPLQAAYVDANFKEVQLADVRSGQRVKLTSDLFGNDVVYDGTVVGFAGGTGSAFALVPSQNATGNWIKVVQRLPVRIALDPKQLAQHPLQVGLSMTAEIELTN